MPTLPKIDLPKLDLPKIELPRPKAPSFDVNLPAVSPKPLYAGAGVADLAVAAVKEYAAGVQKKLSDYRSDATARFAGAKKSVTAFEPTSLPAKARASYADFSGQTRKTVTELQADVRSLPGKARAKLDETTSSATDTYADLAKRGEVFVAKLRGKAVPAAPTKATKAPAAKTTTTKTTTTKTTTAKTTAKKAPAKKAPAKTAAKKAPVKKDPAKTAAASGAKKTTTTSATTKSATDKA